MSGAHARQPERIRLSVWRPLAVLALVGASPPAVLVSGAVEARSAPAPSSAPDLASEALTAAHTVPVHPCRCGTRTGP